MSARTFVGSGSTDTFFEPGGLSFAGDKLYVADTNNHRIQVIDMNSRQITTLHCKAWTRRGTRKSEHTSPQCQQGMSLAK